MFRWINKCRGIKIKDEIFCPFHQKTYLSEDELPPRQFKNRCYPENATPFCGRGRRRGCGRRNGFGCRWI